MHPYFLHLNETCFALQYNGMKMCGSFSSKQNGSLRAMQISRLPVITRSLCSMQLIHSVPLTQAQAGNNLQMHIPIASTWRLCLVFRQETIMSPLRPLHFSLPQPAQLQALLCFTSEVWTGQTADQRLFKMLQRQVWVACIFGSVSFLILWQRMKTKQMSSKLMN